MGEPIGDLNGKYSWLFRTALLLLPFAIMWGVYMTTTLWQVKDTMNEIHIWIAKTDANRFTAQDFQRERTLLMQHHMPPQWVREKLISLNTELKRQQVQIDRLEGHDDGRGYNGD